MKYTLHSFDLNTSDTEVSTLGLHLFISNDIVSTKIYEKRGVLILKLEISLFRCMVMFYEVYISQLIRFARASGHVADFNSRRNFSNFAKLFSKFYCDTMI